MKKLTGAISLPGGFSMSGYKVFRGIDPFEQSALITRFTTVETYSQGEAIVCKGDPGTALFIVLLGQVQVRLGTFEVNFHPGDFLGELAFLDGQPRSAKVVAIEDGTQIAFLSQKQMAEIKANQPQLAIIILHNLGIGLAAHLRRTSEALLAAGSRARHLSTQLLTATAS